MIWLVADFVFAQNAGRKRPTIAVFVARMNNAQNVVQNYCGKILIITSCLKKRELKRTLMDNSQHYAIPAVILLTLS